MNALAVAATLPVTGAVVPAAAAAFTVKVTGEMKTHDGVAFTCDVHAPNGDMVGTIENSGRGGGTWLRPAAAAARIAWEALVEAYGVLAPDEVAFSEEGLADALAEEAMLTRDLNRKRNMVVRLDGDGDQILLFNTKATAPARAHIAATYGDRAQVWDKATSGWVAP